MERIIFFDGVCNLCNASVQFAIERDKKNLFKFTALQGEYAKAFLPKLNVDLSQLNSIILLEDGQLYTKSTAALKIARKLNGLWPILYVFILVPKFIRDWFYDIIAKNRYKWWGRQESCWLPTAELRQKFID
ncbi:DCC1-like thiol-disulfide oxidoreductase family protein [Pedobacter sp. MC2016-05]|uniref:thiol-disulfide oxidoreductase DCC family protein n=1 Tax=Pedobacter sp. MC2016-05 TaxID=2994474 RepID=UPI00224514CF|nr:DCC1-like thiol-disulfide oxidoreductase family protein [Pedobacter sp. MC2016-05]MCX2477041.1 DCC1-like thiol-disulfide oxidoreductase family protein [Pedobacter sp. MC2016-05]